METIAALLIVVCLLAGGFLFGRADDHTQEQPAWEELEWEIEQAQMKGW